MSARYLLDANVLIEANAQYYQPNRIPQFWLWLADMAKQGIVKMPGAILAEITPSDSDEPFKGWLSDHHRDPLLDEPAPSALLSQVLDAGYGYSQSPDSRFVEEALNDALLVAFALTEPETRRVVTLERWQTPQATLPSSQNRKIPLVCRLLDVTCINTFDLIRELDFRIPL